MIVTGRLALVAVVAGLLVAVVSPRIGTLLAVNAALLLLVAWDVLRAASPKAVSLAREGATRVRLGETAAVGLTVHNTGSRRLIGTIRDAWPPTAGARLVSGIGGVPAEVGEDSSGRPDRARLALGPGARVVLTTEVTPTRRGDREADHVGLRTVGPLGLAGRQRKLRCAWTVRTLPPFTSRRLLPSRTARLRDIDGASVVHTRGEGTEFDSLRTYVAGDDVRSIDWRATARASDVMLRTWRPERDRRLLLVLDTGRTSAARVGDETRLDVSIDAALLMTALAKRAQDTVDVLAFDRGVRAQVRHSSSASMLSRTVDALAPVPPSLIETDARALVSTVLARSTKRSLIVLFTGLDKAVMEEGLLPVLPALTSRHLVMIAAVTDADLDALRVDREDTGAVYQSAAAAATLAERSAIAARLRRLGCVVVDAPADDLAARVADTYLDLKAAGRL